MSLRDDFFRFDAAFIKRIAIICMFIDHMTLSFLEVARDAQGQRIMFTFPAGKFLDSLGRGIGRLAFPVFCFFIVEGFLHTGNRWKYLARLLVFAVISQAPFVLLVFPDSQKRHADTIFTLAAGYVLIWIVDTLAEYFGTKKYMPGAQLPDPGAGEADRTADGKRRFPVFAGSEVLGAALFLILSAGAAYGLCRLAKWGGFDYSYGGVLCILILYVFYHMRDISLCAAWAWLTCYNQNEMLAITGFGLIRCYNGKRGRQNKYFFYLFYPGHLLALYLIRKAIWGI